MTNSELAAWVQAVGSILAILGAFGVAVWQSNRQHKSALNLMREQHKVDRTELARTLLTLGTCCLNLLNSYAKQLYDRESIHNAAEGQIRLDLNELRTVEGAVHAIPLHSLPYQLVGLTLLLRSVVRQFRENVELALKKHRAANAAEFEKFFAALSHMQQSIKRICDEIQVEVSQIEAE